MNYNYNPASNCSVYCNVIYPYLFFFYFCSYRRNVDVLVNILLLPQTPHYRCLLKPKVYKILR